MTEQEMAELHAATRIAPQQPKATRRQVFNVNVLHQGSLTAGNRIADGVASFIGSWRFVLGMTTFLAAWIAFNIVVAIGYRYDRYPFILLNLFLSFLASYTGSFILMSQNRQAARDHITADADFHVNTAAKEEVEAIATQVALIDAKLELVLLELKKRRTGREEPS